MAAPLGRSATASAGAARRRLDQARRTARTQWAGSARISRSISGVTAAGSSGPPGGVTAPWAAERSRRRRRGRPSGAGRRPRYGRRRRPAASPSSAGRSGRRAGRPAHPGPTRRRRRPAARSGRRPAPGKPCRRARGRRGHRTSASRPAPTGRRSPPGSWWRGPGRTPSHNPFRCRPHRMGGRLAWSGQCGEVEMGRVQVFDVNETLLDLAGLDPHFERIFGDHAMAALVMTAERAGVPLADDDKKAVAAQLRQLPAHPEVDGALRRLRDAGVRLAALTNSTEEVARAQLEHAGLIDTFELVLSADTVGRLKPAPEPYRMAAERLGVAVDQVRLIAAHAWDVAGAARAGCATAFVARPGKVLDPLVERPEIVGADLTEVADAILTVDQSDDRGGVSATPAPSA